MVNALLTQLDKLKTKKNVMVMTTSNIAGAIGESRAPKQYERLTIHSQTPRLSIEPILKSMSGCHPRRLYTGSSPRSWRR